MSFDNDQVIFTKSFDHFGESILCLFWDNARAMGCSLNNHKDVMLSLINENGIVRNEKIALSFYSFKFYFGLHADFEKSGGIGENRFYRKCGSLFRSEER